MSDGRSKEFSNHLGGYAICTEQRSGSSYLCQVLASTGVLGQPTEYFNGPSMAMFCPNYPQDTDGQINAIMQQGASDNGIYGLKLFSRDFDRIAQSKWTRRLPNLRFVSLVRRDLLAQAISSTRLRQTGQFSADAEVISEPFYDRAHIESEIGRLAWGQARWCAFFSRCGIEPLRIDYEQVSADPQQTAQKVANLVGWDGSVTVDPHKIYTRLQRDSLSDEWRERFIAEAGDQSFLDSALPSSMLSLRLRVKEYMVRWRKKRQSRLLE